MILMSGYHARPFAAGGGRAARRALLLLLATLFQAPLLDAAVIYVSTNTGSDANSGLLSSAPKSTLNSAFSAASNGDTIKIASGVYTESLDAMNKSLAFEGGYAADFLSRDYAVHRSTVMGRFWVNTGGLNVGFDGIAVSSGLTPFYLYWSGNSYSTVTITNSVIFNSSAPAIDTYGSQYFSLTVASSTIYNCRTGIALGPAVARTAAIRHNTISEIREFGGNIGDGKTGVGIDAQGTGPLDISSNTISRAEIYGIDGGYPNGVTLVAGNVITDCGSGGLGGYSNGGIRFAAGSVQIRNNLIVRCASTGIILDYSNYGSVIRNNTIVGANTTFAIEEGSGAVFRNNIIFNAFYGFSGTDTDVTEIAHNIFGDNPIEYVQSGLYDFKEAGLSFFTPTMHDNLVVPAASTAAVFANAAAGDYRLAANSIAADAGDPDDPVGDEPGPNGGRIDCGAYGGLALSPASETVPPGAVADLAAASGANVGEIDLAWSAPGDDGAADRNIYGAYYELRYATYPLTGYTTAQWWTGADLYAPQTAWIVAEDTSVTKSLDVGNLSTQPMGVPGFAERHTLVGLEPGVSYYFMLKTTDNSGNVSEPDVNSAAAGTMAYAPAQGSGNHAPVLGHTSDNALGPVSQTTDGTSVIGVKFRVKDPDGAADTSTIAVRNDQYYTYGPQFRVDGGTWDDIRIEAVSFSSTPFVPAADFSGTEYTLAWITTRTVTSAESAAAEIRFKVTDGSSESLWASTGPFMLDNKRPANPYGGPTYRKPVSLKFNWGQSTDINFTEYRVLYATYSFSQCYAADANREWTGADDAAMTVRTTTFTVVTGLTQGVTYWYYVEARDSYGHRSSGSNCIGFSTVTLSDYGAPGQVTDLAASPAPGNSGGITLEWTVPGNDGASGGMTDALYIIKYSTLGIISAAAFDSPPQPHYTLEIPTNTVLGQKNRVFFTGLTPGTSFWFAIKVKDSADLWSVWSSSQDVPSDNIQAFSRAKDYGTDPALGVFSGNFSQAGGAVYDGTGPDEAYALAVDTISAGGPYVYAVGVSSTGGPIAPYDYMIVKYDAAGNKLLSRYYHNSWGDTAYAAAVDQAGNLLVTGQTTTGNGDWLTLKLDPNLDLLSSALFNGEAGRNDTPRGLAVDTAGNVFVTGGVGNASGQPSYHTIKYSSDLAVVLASATWDKGGSEEAQAVAVDPSGNIIVTGGDGADYFTIKYSNALAVISSAAFNGSGNSGDTAYGAGTDAGGNIYVAGSEWGVSGWTNYLTIKYSPDLSVVLASASFNGPANNSDYAYALAVDTAGYVLVAGKSWNASGNDDFVTLKYSPSLNLLHSDSYDGGGSDIARAVAAGPGGYTYIAGYSGSYPATDFRVLRRVMSDITPPAGVADLAAQSGTGVTGEVKLFWTAPGDDEAAGNISGGRYELKYTSAAIITSANYASPPEPSYTLAFDTGTVAGQSVNVTVTGLLPGASYWFALKTRDEAGYWSVWASSQDSPGDNNSAYAAAKRPGNDPPLGVFSGDFSQAGGAVYNGTGPDQAYGVAVDTFSPGGPYVYVVGSSSMSGSAIPQDWLVVKYGPQGDKLVSQRLGGTNGWNDYARAAAVDPWGNLIVAGYLMTPSQDNYLVVKYDQNLDIISSATYNGAANSWDEAYGVAADRDGNILVTGQSRNSSNSDYFTIKYSSAMVVLGSATYNGGTNETAYAVASNASGHVIVTGTNGSDFFTIKYSADLSSVLSSATFAGSGGSYDAANAAAVDPDGNIVIAGEEWAGAGSENYRVVKYNPELTAVLVSTSFNGAANGNDYAYGVTVDTSANVTVTGKSQNSGGNFDICTVKFDPNLSVLIASAVYNGGGEDTGRAVAAGNSGYVYTAGYSANGSNDDFRALRSQFPDMPPPPALSGGAAGISSIAWSWNDVNLGETGYRLIASTGGFVSGALAANTVTWPETGLSTNTAYTRSVVALNMPGTSTSTAVTRWTLAAPPASAAAAVLSSTAINVSWTANDNPAGTDFEVSYSSADAFLTGSAVSTAPLTKTYSAALGGLLPYTTYYVRVRAYNGDGLPADFAVAPSTRTSAPPPDALFVSQAVPAAMASGVPYAVSVTMRNTGLLPWTRAGLYRLGSENPLDNQRWGPGRVELDEADSIGPGQEKTFSFTVTAPLAPGTTDFQWRMIQEGVQWFGERSQNLSIAVSSNAAEFVSMSVPEAMISGKSYRVSVVFRNTGDTTWTRAGQYRLGSQDPYDNLTWLRSTNRVELAEGDSVSPGANATYYFTVTGSSVPGANAFRWRLLQEGVQWFPQTAAVTPSTTIAVAPSLEADRKAYLPGETPALTLTGAPPGAPITWYSWKDGVPAESGASYGQSADSSGGWSGSGAAFVPGDAGFWLRRASAGGHSGEVRYVVASTLTAAVPALSTHTLAASHVAGDYRLTAEPFLLEGAKLAANLNPNAIFVYLTPEYSSRDYPATDFGPGPISDLEDLARSEPYQQLFSLPFSTYVITAYSFATYDWVNASQRGALTPAAAAAETAELYGLARYLLQTYQGTGKTFILKNWEGDWAMNQSFDPYQVPDSTQIAAMTDWLGARHAGVAQARAELAALTGVRVADAIEFNLPGRARWNIPSLLGQVAPAVDSDYLAYSAWESVTISTSADLRRGLLDDIAFIRAHPAAAGRDLIISEYGFRESAYPDSGARTAEAAQAFLDAAVPLAFYWGILDNECQNDQPGPPGTCQGYGLLRQDGERAPAWSALRTLLGAQNAASFVSQSVPLSMRPGETREVTVTLRNDGDRSWDAANGYKLASANPADNDTWGLSRVALSSSAAVQPGGTYAWSFTAGAPASAGAYDFQWRMKQEGVEDFGAASANLSILVVSAPPAQPALDGAALGTSSLTWTWADADGEDGYRLLASTGGYVSGLLAGGVTALDETALSTNTAYTRLLTAFNAAGASTSTAVTRWTLAAPPVNAVAAAASSTTMNISWDANGNPAGTDFEVSYSSADAFATGAAISTAPLTQAYSAALDGLLPYTTYYVRVRAFNGAGSPADFAVAASTRTNPATPPAPQLSASADTASIYWTWNDVDYEDGYTLFSATAGAVSHVFGPGATGRTDAGAGANVCFTRYVSAFNISGSSASVPLSACTLAEPPASPYTSVNSQVSIELNWGDNGNSPATTYEVSYSSADAFVTGPAISTVSAGADTFLTLAGLQPYTTYYARVRSYNLAGLASDFSVLPSTRTNAPPPAASVLSGAALGVSSIAWTWTDVQYEDGYRLRASTGGVVTPPLGAGAAAWTETGLSTNTAYTRSLEAFNITGFSQTPQLARWTLAAPPAGLTFQEVFFTSVTLAWSENGNPAWTDYSVSLWAAGGSTTAVTVNGSTASFTGLTPGVTYYVAVLALNGAGVPSEGLLASSVTARQSAGAGLVTPGGGGTVTFNAEAGEVRLEVPPGAFAAPVNITIQAPASLPSGRAAELGLAPVGVGAEIIPDTAAQPAGGVTLVLNYRDSDVSGLDENLLVLARYDEPSATWLRLPSSPDPAANRVTALVDHFSLYQVMVYTPSQTSSGARAYPNPCRAAAGCAAVTISRLRPGAKATIYTLSGELVRALTADSLGFAVWDKRNSSGTGAAGGVYLVVVKDGGRILKIALIK